ncbi:urease accessory protein UreF [Alcaligenaceae bacterium LF4-65]|uniref:Urease accessory protein UreF n=1 Tax=Zwartia hollandica TaxID=324606 RepID=A0A953T3B5_9BURK|nr:urease accessory protein UreF [Zwartia hollandica]MBZ1351260.1 urease accessory protein UreF [Zwartia hollandica]
MQPTHATNADAILAALHLASPALPVGGFAYSQGLEQAIEDRWVTDMQSAYVWIRDGLVLNLARQELPWWLACYQAAADQDWVRVVQINEHLHALRETGEFRLESVQMGHSMAKLFAQWPQGQSLVALTEIVWVYPSAYAALAAVSGVTQDLALSAYLWSWVENQVLAAVKSVPLGQIEGQTLLHRLKGDIVTAIGVAQGTAPEVAGSAAFGLAITSARHETQYSRLFRS